MGNLALGLAPSHNAHMRHWTNYLLSECTFLLKTAMSVFFFEISGWCEFSDADLRKKLCKLNRMATPIIFQQAIQFINRSKHSHIFSCRIKMHSGQYINVKNSKVKNMLLS